MKISSVSGSHGTDKILPDPSIPDNAFRTVLHCAAQVGNPSVCESILKFSSNLNISKVSDSYGATCLHYASLNDHNQTLNIFLNYSKMDTSKFVNYVDVDNRSALHWAVTKGSVEVISTLLQSGANSNHPDCQGTDLRRDTGRRASDAVSTQKISTQNRIQNFSDAASKNHLTSSYF